MNQAAAVAADIAACATEQKRVSRRLAARVRMASLFGDTLVVFLALSFSSWLRFETFLVRVGSGAGFIPWTDYFGHVVFGTVLFMLLLPHREMYDLRRMLNLRQTLRHIVEAGLSWLVLYTAFSWLLRFNRDVSRVYVVLSFAVAGVMLVVWRTAWHAAIGSEAIARHLRRRLLFVGWSRPAEALARAVLADERHVYEICGYVPLPLPTEPGGPEVFVREVADLAHVAEALREREVDAVLLADSRAAPSDVVALADLCEREMAEFQVIPSGFQILQSCLRLQSVSGVPVLGSPRLPLDDPLKILLKRAIDLVGGTIGLILSAPLIALFGALVRRESPGPVIYRQRRVGQDGQPFWILKIRSMRLDAERDGRAGWTVRDDPRRLRVGAFMRRWNIDELPQFWNVIRGEMSLVGPRPERPELIKVLRDEIPHYNTRHAIKPGLTGWAQVNGFRGDTDLNERIRCDLYYIENWSLALDLQIVAMTLWTRTNAG